MKFGKIVFWIAGIWGILVLTPLYFIFDMIGRQDPPPITHPGFYYGFASLGLGWQVAFFVTGSDPVCYRWMMIPSALEKFGYSASLVVLCLQHRMHSADLTFAAVDLLLGMFFLIAFFKATNSYRSPE